MDTCSFFIDKKALFGGYPGYNSKELEELGVEYFVDLTTSEEKSKLNVYTTDKTFIQYEIIDRFIPKDLPLFSNLIVVVSHIIKNLKDGQYIYIHCKGGHGRAGLVVSCILCYFYNYSSKEAMMLTNESHNNRKIMKDRWRRIGSPQTDKQKGFVIRMFKDVYINNINGKNTFFNLNNNSKHPIYYKDMQYKSVNLCYYCNVYPKYKRDMLCCGNYYEVNKIVSKIRLEKCNPCIDTRAFMKELIHLKLSVYVEVLTILKNTYLRPIKYVEDGIDVGKIYEEYRNDYLLSNSLLVSINSNKIIE